MRFAGLQSNFKLLFLSKTTKESKSTLQVFILYKKKEKQIEVILLKHFVPSTWVVILFILFEHPALFEFRDGKLCEEYASRYILVASMINFWDCL